ncbi:hypothetical protein WJR50_06230 [Catalinimonas sp. 4WD22]|uniref:hypothetical protein n=1 Tax=Catalinimonas locisalis TaxID=3133978 RepID=UPI00310139DB
MKLKYLVAFVLAISKISFLQAQEEKNTIPIVTWDNKTNAFDQPLPFDRDFYIKIPKAKAQSIENFKIEKGRKKTKKVARLQRKVLERRKAKDEASSRLFTRDTTKIKNKIDSLETDKKFTKLEYKRLFAFYDRYKEKNLTNINFQDDEKKPTSLDLYNKDSSQFIKENEKESLVHIFPLNPHTKYHFEYTLTYDDKNIDKYIEELLKMPVEDETPDEAIAYEPNLLASLSTFTEKFINDTNLKIIDSLKNQDPLASSLDSLASIIEFTNKDEVPQKIGKFIDANINKDQSQQEEKKQSQILIDSLNSLLINKETANAKNYLINFKNQREKAARDSIKNYLNKGKQDSAIFIMIRYDLTRGNNSKNLKKDYNELIALKEKIKINDINLNKFLDCYQENLTDLANCTACDFDKTLLYLLDSINNYLIPNFYLNNEALTQEVNIGLLPVNYLSVKEKADTTEYSKRISNLTKSIDFVEKILTINWHDNVASTSNCRQVDEVLDSLHHKKSQIEKYVRDKTQFGKKIATYEIGNTKPLAKYITNNSQGTSNSDLTTESKGQFTIRPDLGLAFSSNFITTSPTGTYNAWIPFFGIRFNFRPINNKYAFRDITYKNLLHHSSINISYSPVSIADGRTRFNLFNSNNLLVGYGFRINNLLNLSAGALLFNRKDKEPFVSEKRLAAMPYVALTMDFGITDTIKSIADAFKFK